MNFELLSYLKKRAGRWLAPLAVARALQLTPRALRARLKELELAGFKITEEPHRGLLFGAPPWPLLAEEISARISTHIIGRGIQCLGRTTSTNDVARRLCSQGALEGTIVLADYQSQGRGRFRRKWVARPGEALLMTVLLRPDGGAESANLITIMGAVAVASAIGALYAIRTRIRWPNDVMIGDRKVAGVLVERDTAFALLLGIGVNTGRHPEAPAATSLAEHAAGPVDRDELAARIAAELDKRYLALLAGKRGELEKDWREISFTLGKRVGLTSGQRTFHGEVVKLSLEGITIRFASGRKRLFRAEHVKRLEVLESTL